MYAYKIKELAKRGTALLGAAGMLAGIGTTALPVFVSADALNPLTERSLALSSSSPGWSYFDGSGNTTYAPPNSGANGQKTGNTFQFRVTTDSSSLPIKAFTFQYCTAPAGLCQGPTNRVIDDNGTSGDDSDDSRDPEDSSHTDLSVHTSSPTHIAGPAWTSIAASASKTPLPDNSQGNFVVLTAPTGSTPTQLADLTYWTRSTQTWTMSSSHVENSLPTTHQSGRDNFIQIVSSTGEALNPNDYVRIIFFGTNTNYITNPGAGAFFVKINDYSSDSTFDDTTLIDGGVTVANVMNQSISIQTKVLETMDFSVGTHDPNTYLTSAPNFSTNTGISNHGQCDPILTRDPTSATYSTDPQNVLQLGDSNAEHSLRTDTAFDVNSYWRLSSNSSGGATVYYTGHTLTNTVNDQISPLSDGGGTGTGFSSQTGTEQFGLAIAHDTGGATVNGSPVAEVFPVGDNYGSGAGSFADFVTTEANDTKVHLPRLYPLVPTAPYGGGFGTITNGGTAKFSFNANADTYAIPLASETTDVVNCTTAKMRYVANIAATTPAGIYTTKVNYVASPQY